MEGSHSGWYGAPGKTIVLKDVPDDATERDVGHAPPPSLSRAEADWLSLQILYGLDYVTRDRHMSTDQVKVVRFRYDHDGMQLLPFLNLVQGP